MSARSILAVIVLDFDAGTFYIFPNVELPKQHNRIHISAFWNCSILSLKKCSVRHRQCAPADTRHLVELKQGDLLRG